MWNISIYRYFNFKHTNKTFLIASEKTQMKNDRIKEKSTNYNLHISASTVELHEIMCNHESDDTQVQIKSFSAVKTGISYLIVLFHNLIMFVVKLNAFASVTPGTLISTLKQFTMTYRIKKSWWIVKTLSIVLSLLQLVWLTLQIHVLCLTSQHIQALHHRGYHNIDPEVALCATAVLGLHLALCQRLSVGVVPLNRWRAEPLKRERKAHVSICSWTFAVIHNILMV